jgi:hypothetical protein
MAYIKESKGMTLSPEQREQGKIKLSRELNNLRYESTVRELTTEELQRMRTIWKMLPDNE